MHSAWQKLVPEPNQKFFDWDACVRLIPELSLLEETPQDPEHHAEGNVGIHTRMVCDALLQSNEYKTGNDDERFVWFYGALLHDISKPQCTKTEETGKITSKGHSKVGAVQARCIMWKNAIPLLLRERICRVILQHQTPFFFFKKEGNLDFHLFKLSHEVLIKDLIVIARADMQGRFYKQQDQCLEDIALFEELSKEKIVYAQPKQFPDHHTRMKYWWTEGGISPDHAFYRENKSHVYLMSGLPGSGKTTWRKTHPDLPVVSFDDTKINLDIGHGDNPGHAIQQVLKEAKLYLGAQTDFIWDATHLSNQMREKSLQLCYQYGATVEIVYCEAPYSEILARNLSRGGSLTDAKIMNMTRLWELPLPTEAHHLNFYNVPSLSTKLGTQERPVQKFSDNRLNFLLGID